MPHITRDLLRKRAEHNEGLLTSLEELTLHQEELEGINDVLGRTCRELKILYLQNNMVPRLEHLHHLKRLEYLNVALNNICVVEGLGSCEFLRKLDLTVNFIDFDALEASVTHLVGLQHMQDLYFLGNPAQAKPWFEGEEEEGREEGEEGEEEEEKKQAFFYYVVHRLPQLQFLDGQEITRSTRLVAARHFPRLEARLRVLALRTRREKEEKAEAKRKEKGSNPSLTSTIDDDELTTHDPETRRAIYLELAAQKQAKEERQKALAPRKRDAEQEQARRVAKLHAKEGEGEREEGQDEKDKKMVRQKNEGKWPYTLQDEDDESSSSSSSTTTTSHPGCITLNLVLPRHLDSSLIDVDVHPTHINIVVKGKLLRLLLPKEVRVEESKAKRSKTTGDLFVVMPKIEGVTTRRRGRYTAAASSSSSSSSCSSSFSSSKPIDLSSSSSAGRSSSSSSSSSSSCSSKRIRNVPRVTLAEGMLAAHEAGCCERTSSSSSSSFSSLASSPSSSTSSSSSLRPLRQAVDVRNIVMRKEEEEEEKGEEGGEGGREGRRVLFKEVTSVRLDKNGEREKEEEGEEEEEEEEGKEVFRMCRKRSAAQEKEKEEVEEEEWNDNDIPPLI